MIDDPIAARELLADINDALPLSAHLTPEAQAKLRDQNASTPIPGDCTITGTYYMGDEGGILCKLDLGADVEKQAFVSITHLRFDPRRPLSRKIIAYQKHRVKRLRRKAP
jgi:hypothetical protein